MEQPLCLALGTLANIGHVRRIYDNHMTDALHLMSETAMEMPGQGADWGVCDSEEDPILAGSFPVCWTPRAFVYHHKQTTVLTACDDIHIKSYKSH